MDQRTDTVIDLRDAPVTIELDALGEHDSVLTALAQSYERQGLATQQMWVGELPDGSSTFFDLAVLEKKMLFDVETIDTLSSLDGHRYDQWRAAGYEVSLVAPLTKLALVRRRLADSVDHIQGWTMNGPQISFATPVS